LPSTTHSIVKSILAVDNLAIQRSLTVLEDRYRELREMGEKRFQALEADKAATAKSAEELQQQLSAQTDALQELQRRESRLEKIRQAKAELEAETAAAQARRRQKLQAEKEAADRSAEELNQKLSAQAETLQQQQAEREQQATRLEEKAAQLEVLEADAAQWKTAAEQAQQQHSAAQQRLSDLEQLQSSKIKALGEAQEENELILLQLHQVQEELEHYFLQSRAGDELAQAQKQQLQRAQALIARLLPNLALTDQSIEFTPVEVLTPQPGRPQLSLQTEALLNTYAASLKRSSALLQRAMNS